MRPNPTTGTRWLTRRGGHKTSNVRQVFTSVLRRAAKSVLRHEAILPHDFHAFDPHSWVIKQTALGFRVWVSLDELAISRAILVDAYETAESAFLAATVRAGDVVVDAGANVGFHTFHLAKLAGERGRVLAFEPLGYLADALEAGVRENGYGDRVTVMRVALAERAGAVRLRHAPRTANFGGAHLAPGLDAQAFQRDDAIRSVRLDDVVGERRIAVIKMDVEGAEPRLIDGARATLRASRPLVVAEIHDAQLRAVSKSDAATFLATMRELGYRCRPIAPDGSLGAVVRSVSSANPVNVVFEPD